MEYSLQMVFLCESGEKSSITISDVKPGLTNSDVVALMNTIIASNIFETSKGALISKYSAQVVQREVEKLLLKSLKSDKVRAYLILYIMQLCHFHHLQ